MKTDWDYTTLADAYLKRPDYSEAAIAAMVKIADMKTGDPVCDIGAGVAHLTLKLAAHGLDVTAVEPNDAMRANGQVRTAELAHVAWHEGTGENTGQSSHAFRMVTFGSSFNVCDRPAALKESARLLLDGGWFACLWNHRDLTDPVQAEIESIIKRRVDGYGYGTRREDQREVIDASGLFGPVVQLSSGVYHRQSIEDCVEAWRSHATLQRQAGKAFDSLIEEIDRFLRSLGKSEILIPYTTNAWITQRR